MAFVPKKKRFLKPNIVHINTENLTKAVPPSDMYKNRWGVRIHEEWQAERKQVVISGDNPFSLDLI